MTAYSTVVIGGGFYGARLALLLRAMGHSVLLVEREAVLLARASLRNQARVHNGYHYPRSILTSLRSRANYARFLDEYAECADRSFPHYYAIARRLSKTTAAQFAEFCRRIDAPLTRAPAAVAALFDGDRIEGVFEVQECAFDAVKLRERMTADLAAAAVVVRAGTEAVRIARSGPRGESEIVLRDGGGETTVHTSLILNCTYSGLNGVLTRSGAAPIAVKHELAELALVEPPAALGGAAVTVMDGPFFSLMPYPSCGLFTLSHVRYTPHFNWQDAPNAPVTAGLPAHGPSRAVHMLRDAARYVPSLASARYIESLWETKTLMPRSEQDDSRPILLRRSEDVPSCLTVLGAKIDSVYDVEDSLRAELAVRALVA